MNLQRILWPKDGICTDIEMYFHSNFKISLIQREEPCILFQKGGIITTDTYFNSLSVEKWRKYTRVSDISLMLNLQGNFIINLCWKQRINNRFVERSLKSAVIDSSERTELTIEFPDETKGMLFFRIESLENGGIFYGGYYQTKVQPDEIMPVKLGIVICTFKREKFVKNNIKLLSEDILQNKDSPLWGKVEVFISDNGQSLEEPDIENEMIHIIKNKNAGGAGGFTRGLMEIIKTPDRRGISHALLMDDDVVVDTASIEKTAAILELLKAEYAEAFIGGNQ